MNPPIATMPPMQSDSLLRWEFGGPLSGLPAEQAWGILGVVALGGLVWIGASYYWTLVRLGLAPRLLLCGLRFLLLLALLTALAGPTRIERSYVHREVRPLALLVDRSDSMTAANTGGERRLDEALRYWRRIASVAEQGHGSLPTWVFADGRQEAAGGLATRETHLFRALQDTLAQAPPGGWAGIVTLTDGLDTTEGEQAEAATTVVRAAAAAGTPLYFVVGRTVSEKTETREPFLTWHDFVVPPQVRPRSTFAIELTVESYQATPRTVPVRLRVGTEWRQADPVFLNAGRRASVWRAEVAAEQPGDLLLEVRAGEGTEELVALAKVAVVAPRTSCEVLHCQGTLDWGQRFLSELLRRDPAYRLRTVARVQSDGELLATATMGRKLQRVQMPTSVAGLVGLDVIVLADVSAAQLGPAEQAALVEWVRKGGALLLIGGDGALTSTLAGSELERALPVAFGPAAEAASPAATSQPGRRYARRDFARSSPPALQPFVWEPKAREVFTADDALPQPMFETWAPVARAKPGAEILARHSGGKTPEGEEAILLAWQRFGRGRSMVMCCDSLWRWKLQQPSGDRAAEKFWQQLFAWLAQETEHHLHFDRAPLYAETGQTLTLRVVGQGAAPAQARAMLTGAKITELASGGATREGVTTYLWTPREAGLWQVAARSEEGESTQHWITVRTPVQPVTEQPKSGEDSGRPADEALLQTLASRTGGAVLDGPPPATWTTGEKERTDLVAERRAPLWHSRAWLAWLIGLYAVELIVRRLCKLL